MRGKNKFPYVFLSFFLSFQSNSKNANSYSGFGTKLNIHLGLFLITAMFIKTKSATKYNGQFLQRCHCDHFFLIILIIHCISGRCFFFFNARCYISCSFAPFAHILCRSCALTFCLFLFPQQEDLCFFFL